MSNCKKSSHKRNPQAQPGISAPSALPTVSVLAGVTIIIVTVVLAYFPAINGEFIWDDNDIYLTKNQIVKSSDGLYRFWCTTEPAEYHPITNTTFWIEWRLWGMNPTGYHVANLILHMAQALLVWIILRKLSIPGAFLAAIIFAVHPVNVESVAWIAQRKNLMAMLFFLLSILCYVEFIKHARPWLAAKQCTSSSLIPHPSSLIPHPSSLIPHPSSLIPHPSSLIWYWLSLAMFVSAMLSKGSAAVLPVLLLGIVWWLRPLTRWDLVRSVPFFLVAAVLTLVHIWFQSHGKEDTIRTAGFVERLLDAGGVVWFYLYKAFLPVNLAFIYPQLHIKVGNTLSWLPLIAALAVTGVLWRYRKSWSRPLLFAWGFYCVALVPVMGLTDVYFMKYSLVADHYQHIALVGAAALAAASWGAWDQRSRGGARWAAIALAVAAVCVLTFLTWRQSGLYSDEITLFQDTLKKNPHCLMAHTNLGVALVRTSRLEDAIEEFKHALKLKPDDPVVRTNLGNVLNDLGRPQEAIEQFEQALSHDPKLAAAHINLGIALIKTGKPLRAIEQYRQALQFEPNSVEAHANLAIAYARTKQPVEAIAAAQKALNLARSDGQTTLAEKLENWLNSYRAGLTRLPNAPPSSKSAPSSP